MDLPAWYPEYRILRNAADSGIVLKPKEQQRLTELEAKLQDFSQQQSNTTAPTAQALNDATGGSKEPAGPYINRATASFIDKGGKKGSPLIGSGAWDDMPEVDPADPGPGGVAPTLEEKRRRGRPASAPRDERGRYLPGEGRQQDTSGIAPNANPAAGPLPATTGSAGPWALEATTQPRLVEIRDAIKKLAGAPPGPGPTPPKPEEEKEKEKKPNITDAILSLLSQPSASPAAGAQSGPNMFRFLGGIRSSVKGSPFLGGLRKFGKGVMNRLKKGKKGKGSSFFNFLGSAGKAGKSGLPVATPVNAAGGAAAGGGAEAGLAAAGGPVGVAVAGVVMLGMAAVEAGKQVYQFARAQEEEIRKLAEVGPQQAAAIARLDAERVGRDIKTAKETGGSSQQLTESLSKFEDKLQPIEATLTNIANSIGSDLLDVVGTALEFIEPILKMLENTYNLIRSIWGGKKLENEEKGTTWAALNRLEQEQRDMNAPKWPTGPTGNSPQMGR